MNINIYSEYEVRILNKSITLSEENETKYDNIFNDEIYVDYITMNGGKLLEKIKHLLDDNYLCEFNIVSNKLHFDYFNYNTGESSHVQFIIEEVKKHE